MVFKQHFSFYYYFKNYKMKKTIIAIAIMLSIGLVACNGSSSAEQTATKDTATNDAMSVSGVKYTCTMHPEIISDTPGKCPKCGMTLVEMKDTTMNMHHDSMSVTHDTMMKH